MPSPSTRPPAPCGRPPLRGFGALRAPGLTGVTEGRYSFARDGLNSTLALLGPSGEVAEAYEYDAWGNLLTPEPQINYFTYTGREWDPGLQQYNYRARVYDPRLGRFGSEDLVYNPKNTFAYVGSNPIALNDPLGLTGMKPFFDACQQIKDPAKCEKCCEKVEEQWVAQAGPKAWKQCANNVLNNAIALWGANYAIPAGPGWWVFGCITGPMQVWWEYVTTYEEVGYEGQQCRIGCNP